ncbi:nitroreductase family deazaflavin-dependent oxidoreductase [Gordonia sp. TBRC 11910]|uniref:Nitroreductase family deazaflavin-dependent oxidoreductase n=1 Tax=Gordonia asplenii TaxID=2725283 RepID=A0A848KZA4_9ACTN|nr:nitroreductase/quinone reductase family protein [Gordonia asplenii]NMO01511.1 nitroreductase family deazaflavin-dependent oxidoreductase [Gordonia asplenii]
MNLFQRVLRAANKVVTPLLHAPVVGGQLSRSMAIITYTGRRSGKTFSTPVNYLAKGDDTLVIGVMMSERKNWWRNFDPGPAPITVTIGGIDRTGTGVVKRGHDGVVRVKVTFDAPT